MDHEQQLKLQAYLDGELSPREAAQIADSLAKDNDAQLLFGELQNTKSALSKNELELKLPESREFFWSKIEREIARQEAKASPQAPKPTILSWLHRYLVPTAGVAVVAVIAIVSLNNPSISPRAAAALELGEVESLLPDVDAYTFRSQSEGMTVVWLHESSDSELAETTGLDTVETQ
jgi:negative regulator of sigma E activity